VTATSSVLGKFGDVIRQARESNQIQLIVEQIPYARFIGMEVMQLGKELIYKLPAKESNIGNPTLPALHGGVIGGFMENSAITHVLATLPVPAVPKVVDFSLDYLRAGRFVDTFCTCVVVRQGRKVANVSMNAWQTRQDEPIAVARCHLLIDDVLE
jgi:acyl-coenzyme A thioesterase PaaI-like protein